MNQEKIGKFIAESRIAKKMTQEELAKRIGVTDKAISKWENSRCLPDVSLFKPLCKELDISVNELLNGEKDKKKENSSGIVDYIDYTNRKNKRKIIFTISISLIIIVILIFGIYFVNNYGQTQIYQLYGKSKNFSYQDGLLTISTGKIIMVSGEITSTNEEIEEKDILVTSIKSEEELIASAKLLKSGNIRIEDNGYNEIFSEEKIKNLDNWYIEIIYLKDKEVKQETIKIENKLIFKNNQFFTKKTESIGEANQQGTNLTTTNDYSEALSLKDNLIKKGYEAQENPFRVVKKTQTEEGTETIAVSTVSKKINYYYEDKAGNVKAINYQHGEVFGMIVELKTEDKNYIYYYDVNEDRLECAETGCPPDAWNIAVDFYTQAKEILEIES